VINLEHEQDSDLLRQAALLLRRENELLHKKLARLSAEVDRLTGRDAEALQLQLAELQRQLGSDPQKPVRPKSERRHGDDGSDSSRPPQTGHGPTEQKQLDVIETVYELDEPDRVCPSCGGELRAWEGQFEESDLIDVVERRFIVRRVKRQKYVCQCKDCVDTALGPAKVVSGGRYSLDFAVAVALGKYLDHLPLERQVRQMRRLGLKAQSQTLWDQIWHLSQLLEPTYAALLSHILSQPVIGMDQTGWPKLSKGARKPWQMWCLTAPDTVYHQIKESKSAEATLELLGSYTGTVVCDAMSSHSAAARDGPGFHLAGCWAHVRRKFFECEPNFPEAGQLLDWIGDLYAIEKRAGDDKERLRLRQTESKALLRQIKARLEETPFLPRSGLGRAVKYTLANWPRLTRFVDDPKVWPDNNLTERALRGPVLGRKNHLGSKSKRGTHVAAIFYSLIETAKLIGLDPAEYLAEAARRALHDAGTVTLPHDLNNA
jgi:transposase